MTYSNLSGNFNVSREKTRQSGLKVFMKFNPYDCDL